MADVSFTSVAVAATFGSVGLFWLYRHLLLHRGIANLQDKVVLITGASSGVGEACAHAFYCAGCKLILCARRVAELERVKKECCELKSNNTTYPPRVLKLDLADLDSIQAIAVEAISFHGNVDILINNGGIGYRGVAMDTSIEVDQRIMAVNYFGSVALTKALLPSMVSSKSGFIVAVSSIQGKIAIPFRTAYAASKFAMEAFFDSLRAEVAALGIQVLVVSPGYIRTNISLSALLSDGTRHGVMDSTTAKGMSPDSVAKRIMGAIARQQQDIVLAPIHHKLSIYLRVLTPSIFNWIMRIRAKSGMAMEN